MKVNIPYNMSETTPPQRFWNYPSPKECVAPSAKYEVSSNPVLRGLPLAIAATMFVFLPSSLAPLVTDLP